MKRKLWSGPGSSVPGEPAPAAPRPNRRGERRLQQTLSNSDGFNHLHFQMRTLRHREVKRLSTSAPPDRVPGLPVQRTCHHPREETLVSFQSNISLARLPRGSGRALALPACLQEPGSGCGASCLPCLPPGGVGGAAPVPSPSGPSAQLGV